MKIGLIDVDNFARLNRNGGGEKACFPNLPLMKLSAFFKQNGDKVG